MERGIFYNYVTDDMRIRVRFIGEFGINFILQRRRGWFIFNWWDDIGEIRDRFNNWEYCEETIERGIDKILSKNGISI